jgi:hypothetical protein
MIIHLQIKALWSSDTKTVITGGQVPYSHLPSYYSYYTRLVLVGFCCQTLVHRTNRSKYLYLRGPVSALPQPLDHSCRPAQP